LHPWTIDIEKARAQATATGIPAFGSVRLVAHVNDALGLQSEELSLSLRGHDRTGTKSAALAPSTPASSAIQPSASEATRVDATVAGEVARNLSSLTFELNEGQHASAERFVARTQGFRLAVRPNETVLDLTKRSSTAAEGAEPDPFQGKRIWRTAATDRSEFRKTRAQGTLPRTRLRMVSIGATSAADVRGEDLTQEKSHYLKGSDPAQWKVDVPHFRKVRISNVYPGIDKVYHSDAGVLEFDWVVRPGADPRVIKQRIIGADNVEASKAGDLLISIAGDSLVIKRPVAYSPAKDASDTRLAVEASYVVQRAADGFDVAFVVGPYDKQRTLIIDPIVQYASYVGGSGRDQAEVVKLDGSANVIVAGFTSSNDLVTLNPVQPGRGDDSTAFDDAFVAKFSSDGKTRLFTTYLGGSRSDRIYSLAVRSDGIFVAGTTESPNFPTTAGAYDRTISSGSSPHLDGFIAKIAPAGSSLLYSTYLGGDITAPAGDTAINGLAVDGSGNAYVTGRTDSTAHPVTAGAYQTAPRKGFVTKFNATATALIYSTYIGGSGDDIPNAIAVDAAGNAYLTGIVHSDDFPTTATAFQRVRKGGADAFVTKLNATGTALVYSTLFGGGELNWNTAHSGWSDRTGFEQGTAIALDSSSNAYIVGQSSSTDMPLAGASFQKTLSSIQIRNGGTGQVWNGDNGFWAKFNPTGSSLLYSTYFGGSASPNCNLSTFPFDHNPANAIAVDSVGNVAIAGATLSPTFPIKDDVSAVDLRRNSPSSVDYNAYVAEFAPSGALTYSTMADASATVLALTYAREGEVIAAGASYGKVLRTDLGGTIQSAPKGDQEAFFVRLSSKATPPYQLTIKAERSPSNAGDDSTLFILISGLTAPAGGQFEYCDGTYCSIIYGMPVTGNGTYKIPLGDLAPGIHSLKVNYSGYAYNIPLSSNVLSHEVKAPSTTPVTVTVSSAVAEATTGDSVNLQVTMGTSVPYGALDLYDNGVRVSHTSMWAFHSPTDILVAPLPTAGTHNFQVKYTGGPTAAPSSSNVVAVTAKNDKASQRLFIASPLDGSRYASNPSNYKTVPVVVNGYLPSGKTVSWIWVTRTVNGKDEPEQQICGPDAFFTSNTCSVIKPGAFSFTSPFALLNISDSPGTYKLRAKIQ
jgi:hypothetical protein